jgi:hypothetical protein
MASGYHGVTEMNSANGLLDRIARLPPNWHEAGNLTEEVIRRMDELIHESFGGRLQASAETGCGKSTLLLSHRCDRHLCFTQNRSNDDSLSKVQDSELLLADRVEFILGPSQRTLPAFRWDCFIDFALIDGAHGYPFPELDYYYFYPQLTQNAILVIDDIHIPTIRRLFEFLCEDDMFDFLGQMHFSAFFRRTSVPSFNPEGDGWWLQKYNQKRFASKEELTPVLGENWWLKEDRLV